MAVGYGLRDRYRDIADADVADLAFADLDAYSHSAILAEAAFGARSDLLRLVLGPAVIGLAETTPDSGVRPVDHTETCTDACFL